MTLSDYRETYSWQIAIDLGRPLTKLSEELPAQEQQGLIMALQSVMVELPAAIANDLLNGVNSRLIVIARLQAALELIERVYPALDTAEPKHLLDDLVERCGSSNFAEVQPAPAAADEDEETEVEVSESPATEATTESV